MTTAVIRSCIIALALCLAGSLAAQDKTSASISSAEAKSTRTFERITTAALIAGKVKGVDFRPDIAYLPEGRKERLDLYMPVDHPSDARAPAVVMIHGGGWVGGTKRARRELELGTALAREGFVAISIEYELREGHRWPQNLWDSKNAVRWLRTKADELGVDPDRIGVFGGSAGGHLSLMVAYTSGIDELKPSQPYPGVRDDVQACVDMYGITDIKQRRKKRKRGSPGKFWAETLLNVEQFKDKGQWRLGSPIDNVTSSVPPTLIIHGTADASVPVEQSIALAERLEEAGVEHKLLIVPEAPHAFSLNDKRIPNDLRPLVINFFRKHLGASR